MGVIFSNVFPSYSLSMFSREGVKVGIEIKKQISAEATEMPLHATTDRLEATAQSLPEGKEATTQIDPEATTSEAEGTTASPRRIMDPHYREKVLDAHSQERGRLNATNMMHLVWDNELEELAWKRALTCQFDHGDYMLPDGTFVGQNLARFPHGTDPYSHVATWIYEKRWFDFETRTCSNFAYCGHYNQMIWHRTNRIGCAHHYCPSLGGDFMVCDYLEFGNYPESNYPAYDVDGAPCSKCDFPDGTACIQNQCIHCANPALPEGSVCRPHGAVECKDNYAGCARILEDFCQNELFTAFVEKYCAKYCGACNW